MPFRPTFDCLWCGRSFIVRDSDDLEGWTQLCPDCLGRAGDNGFLRARLRVALDERAASLAGRRALSVGQRSGGPSVTPGNARAGNAAAQDAVDEDDWYLRRGRHSRGPLHDQAWQADLEAVADWLARQSVSGEIVELPAGPGFWSPILAAKGELWSYDPRPAALDLARERLLAHGLRAHLHERDMWAEPDRQVDAVFGPFFLGRDASDDPDAFLGLVRRWLRPDGVFLFVEAAVDPLSGSVDRPPRNAGTGDRPFVRADAATLRAALGGGGFHHVEVSGTARFFLFGRAAR